MNNLNVESHTRNRKNIPNGWKIIKLNEVVRSLDAGVSVNSDDRPASKNEIGVLKTSSIREGQFLPSENKVVKISEVGRVQVNPKEDSIIISRMNTPQMVGETGYVDKDYNNLYLPDRLWQTNLFENVSGKWLCSLLNLHYYKKKIQNLATGTSNSMKNISKKSLLSLEIPLPSHIEQEKIAEIISTWDKAIELKQQLIDLKKEQKKGLMQKLLTGEVRLPGFTEDWKTYSMREVSKIVTGTTPSTKKEEYFDKGKYPWVTPSDINDSKNIYTSERKLSDEGIEVGRYLPKDSLLVTCIASIGKNAILKKEGSCNQQINAVLPSENHSNEFLYYLIEKDAVRLENLAGKSATSIINKSTFEKYKITIPIKTEQVEIAKILSNIDMQIELTKNEINYLKEQKKGLMQQLLTGQTRVKV